jgi:hypothetical protein
MTGLKGEDVVSDVQLFQTRMGQKFYDGTMPRIAAALEEIAKSLAVIAAATKKEQGDADKRETD